MAIALSVINLIKKVRIAYRDKRLCAAICSRFSCGKVPFNNIFLRFFFYIKDKTRIIRLLDYSRCDIRMVVDSWIEDEVRLHSAKKEPTTVRWIEEFFRTGDVFYDIGANVGAYSLIAYSFLKGKTKIYAFEPGFVTFPQLCHNIYLNDAGRAITPLQVALSDRDALIPFHYQNLITGGALHALGSPVDQNGQEFDPIFTLSTLSFKLDDMVESFGLEFPHHIKIDVDGIEFQILKGAIKTLKQSRLRSLLLEFNRNHEGSDKIDELLKECNLVLYQQHVENNLYVRKNE